jgi:hypothetical protein
MRANERSKVVIWDSPREIRIDDREIKFSYKREMDLEATHAERSYLEMCLNRSATWCSLIGKACQVFKGIRGAYFIDIGIYTWEWEFEGGKGYSVVFYIPNG